MGEFKDYLGKTLAVGDEVLFIDVYSRNFDKGKIIKFTATLVTVEYDNCRPTNRESHRLIKM